MRGAERLKHKIPKIEQLVQTDFAYYESRDAVKPPLRPFMPNGQQEPLVVFYRNGSQYFYHALRAIAEGIPLKLDQVNWRETVSVCSEEPLDEMIRLLVENDYILVTNDCCEPIGYLTASNVLQAVHQAYQYLESYFEAMIETMDASITLIDEQKRTVVWTKGAEHIFSIKAKEIIGKPISDFFPVEMLQTLKTLQTGEKVFRKQHQPRPDLYVLINSNPIRLKGEIVGSVAAEMDITSSVRLNQELFIANSKLHHLQQQVAQLSPSSDPFMHIKGASLAIKKTIEMCKTIGTTKATALILGESGVGKELFAKAIHDVREKPDAPFIAINCGAIPPSLFESELFGYEKGAFSGADLNGKRGKIELARGGTLFLDEIGEMPLDMQVKMLRVLQEKKYFPVGGTKQLDVDFRVIAATNRDLEALVKQGQFREDLFYRLNVVTVEIPPLRERKEDIIQLALHFLHEFSISYNRLIQSIPQDVMMDMMQYDWPGNIRELRNAIERLVVFAVDGTIKREYLPMSIYSAKASIQVPEQEDFPATVQPLHKELEAYEKQIIIKTLDLEKGNKLAAAKRLGMSRATLYNKMNKLGLLD